MNRLPWGIFNVQNLTLREHKEKLIDKTLWRDDRVESEDSKQPDAHVLTVKLAKLNLQTFHESLSFVFLVLLPEC